MVFWHNSAENETEFGEGGIAIICNFFIDLSLSFIFEIKKIFFIH